MKLSCRRPRPLSIALLAVLATLTACDKPTPSAHAQASPTAAPAAHAGIAWREGGLEAAFAEARDSGKPILLYWGAAWCAPCNRLKATLFQDPAFIAQTRHFVAVHLDGDAEGTLDWGERFGIKGYPTIIVLRSDRSEVTRLAGNSDTARLADVLRVVATSTTTVKQLLDKAQHTPQELSADDWAVLGNYGWGMDDSLVKSGELPALLARLSERAPQPSLRRRFALAAIVAPEDPPTPSPANRAVLEAILADPAEVRANLSTLNYVPAWLVKAGSTDAGQRARLSAKLDQALDAVYADPGVPINDRLETAFAKIELARLAQGQPTETAPKEPQPPLPAAVVETVHQRVQTIVAATRTAEEHQSITDSAAALLSEVGDSSGAEQLLLAEVGRSKTPYYYMPRLSQLAEERGDRKTALSWLKKNYTTASSPVARAQSGARYADGLIRLSPEDSAAIEAVVTQAIDALAAQSDADRQRSRKRFARLGSALKTWSKQHQQEGTAVLARLRQKMQASCGGKNTSECTSWLS